MGFAGRWIQNLVEFVEGTHRYHSRIPMAKALARAADELATAARRLAAESDVGELAACKLALKEKDVLLGE